MDKQREKFIEWKKTISGEKVPDHGFVTIQDDCMFHAWKAAMSIMQPQVDMMVKANDILQERISQLEYDRNALIGEINPEGKSKQTKSPKHRGCIIA